MSSHDPRDLGPALLLTAFTFWCMWRIFKDNRGNWMVTFGALAVALFFSGVWFQDSLPSWAFLSLLLAGFYSALVAFFIALKRLVSWLRKGTFGNATEGDQRGHQ